MNIRMFKRIPGILLLLAVLMIQYSCESAEREILVVTLEATDISRQSVRLQGAIIDAGNSGISEYGFRYSISAENYSFEDYIDLGETDASGTFSYVLEIDETVYYVDYYAYAEDADIDQKETLVGMLDFGSSEGELEGEQQYIDFTVLPPAVIIDSVTNITGSSAKVHYRIKSNGNVNRHGVKWYKSNDPATVYDETVVLPSTSWFDGTTTLSTEISGLEGNADFTLWCFANDGNGTGNSAEYALATIATKPIVTTVINELTHSSANVGGEVDNGGLTITEKGVWYGTSSSPETTGTKLTLTEGSGTFNTDLSGLQTNTTYHVKAYATNSMGTSYGEELSFTTWAGSVEDYDGNKYGTIIIGSQEWMGENLKTTHYADGTGIPVVEDNSTWNLLGSDDVAMCYYDNSENNLDVYGALYTWAAVMYGKASSNTNPSGVQGICPNGWHVPSHEEWNELTDYLGDWNTVAGKLKETGTAHWSTTDGNVTNETRFTALPGGQRYSGGSFSSIGNQGYWWTATDNGSPLYSRAIEIRSNEYSVHSYGMKLNSGFSVRCVKD